MFDVTCDPLDFLPSLGSFDPQGAKVFDQLHDDGPVTDGWRAPLTLKELRCSTKLRNFTQKGEVATAPLTLKELRCSTNSRRTGAVSSICKVLCERFCDSVVKVSYFGSE